MKKTFRVLTLITMTLLLLTSCNGPINPNFPINPDTLLNPSVNIYPSQSELIQDNNFYARWTKSTEDDSVPVTYTITYAQSLEGLEESYEYETQNNFFLFPNLEGGVWYWQVKASIPTGKTVTSPVWTFTIDTGDLPIPKDPEQVPADPMLIVSDVQNTSFTLDWDEYVDPLYPANEISYTINIYKDDNQSANRTNVNNSQLIHILSRSAPATTANTTDISHLFNNMDANTKYIWTLIASADASRSTAVGNGPVRTGNRPPTLPELTNPENNATDVATNVSLSWTASTDPDGDEIKYYIYIDTVKNTNRTVTVDGINTTSYQPQDLIEGRTYYWFILVKDNNGAATRTQTQQFSTQAFEGMNVPTNPTPPDETNTIDPVNPPELQWEHDKKDNTITYSIYLSDNPNEIEKIKADIAEKAYQIPEALKDNTKYYWQVEAKDTQTDKTTLSSVWTFKTIPLDPPTQTQAQTNREGTQVELTYDKPMKDPAGKHSQYTIKKTTPNEQNNRQEATLTITQIAIKAGTDNQYVLNLESPVESTDNLTIDYTQGSIQAQDGSYLDSYTDYPIENNVPGEKPVCTQAGLTEDGQQIRLTFSKPMQAPTGTEHEQFGVLVNGYVNEIESATLTEATCITLGLQKPIGKNNQVHVSYIKGTIQSTDGAYLESFQNKVVNTSTVNAIWVIKGVGWNYSSIQEAVDDVEEEATIIVFLGTYVENIDFGVKEIHLSSSFPTDLDVAASTVIAPANQALPVVTINGNQSKTTLEGFKITEGATGVYCHASTVVFSNNIIEGIDCAVELKNSHSTLSNNLMGSHGTAVYMTNSEPVINDNQILGVEQAISILASTPTIYNNLFHIAESNGIYLNKTANVKNEEGRLWQVFNMPYTGQAIIENYTDDATSNLFFQSVVMDVSEGGYIRFDREPTQTKNGTFAVSSASVTSNQGENITIQASYTPAEFLANGTITYTLDSVIDLSDVSITINGQKREVEVSEIEQQSSQRTNTRSPETNKIHINDIDSEVNEPIILEIVQTEYLFEQTPSCTITLTADRDGPGQLYTPSEQQSDSFIIENKLQDTGKEGEAYDIINNGDPFWTYTVKVYKDQMPVRLQNIDNWAIKVDGTDYEFRTTEWENVLQTDDIPSDGDITEQDIKESLFEPIIIPG